MSRLFLYVILTIVFGYTSLLGLYWTFSNGPEIVDSRARYIGNGRAIIRDFNEKTDHDHVLILTPLKNSEKILPEYFEALEKLTYPPELLSLGFLVSDSSDRTWTVLQTLAKAHQRRRNVHQVTLLQKDYRLLSPAGKERHNFEFQMQRRAVMARSRSFLLASALKPEVDWVLWLDADVTEYRPSLIHDLLKHRHRGDVIVPNCMWHTYNEEGPFDRNNWQETEASLALKETLSTDEILIEGYPELKTHRKLLIDLYDPDHADEDVAVPLDGVGGCCTLVQATLHREGAIFPAYAFDHQIETEGFAQMVKRLGGRILGLPAYHVYHVLK